MADDLPEDDGADAPMSFAALLGGDGPVSPPAQGPVVAPPAAPVPVPAVAPATNSTAPWPVAAQPAAAPPPPLPPPVLAPSMPQAPVVPTPPPRTGAPLPPPMPGSATLPPPLVASSPGPPLLPGLASPTAPTAPAPPAPPIDAPPPPSWSRGPEFAAPTVWAPAPHPTAPRRRGRFSLTQKLMAAAVVVALLVGGIAFVTMRKSGPSYPKHWDARIEPIAQRVAELRGLTFQHPVAVHFVSPAEFEKDVGVDEAKLSAGDRVEVERGTAELRAVGLIGGDVNLLDAFDQAQSAGVLAYYDPMKKEIFVRGETLDVAHKATLAHELTHVLQDQHFDLQKLQADAASSKIGDSDALDAIVEGDAERVEDKYVAGLSAAERKEYEQQNDAEGDRVDAATSDVPDIVDFELGAPYALGPYTIRVQVADGGNAAIDRALDGRPLSARMYVEPGEIDATAVTAATVPAGAKADGDPDTLSAFDVYTMLGARGDAYAALRAADAVVGGTSQMYRGADGSRCISGALTTKAAQGHSIVFDQVRAWAARMPRADAAETGAVVTFHSCDSGNAATNPPSANFEAVVALLSTRGELTAEIAESGVSADIARCAARLITRDRSLVAAMLRADSTGLSATAAQKLRAAGAAAGVTCRADPNAGLDV